MTKVQDYDSIDYDYRKYWKDREYENLSERNILTKIIKEGYNFIDIGGAYGRLTDLYQVKYKYSILFDYSYKNLTKAKTHKNVYKVCGDLYNLPFADNSIQSGMLIRVMHHIEKPEKAIKEISRVINSNFILEFPNKNNFASLLRHKFSKDFMSSDKYEIPHSNESQGYIDDQIFLNFSYNFMKKELEKNNFSISNKFSVSNFRERHLKKLFPLDFLIKSDNLFQGFFSYIYFGPSIFLYLEKKDNKKFEEKSISEIIICQKCKILINNKGKCPKCNRQYKDSSGIFNFRPSSE